MMTDGALTPSTGERRWLQLGTEAHNQHLNPLQNIFKSINHNVDMQLCARSHSAGREEALVRCDGFHNISACFLPPKAVTVPSKCSGCINLAANSIISEGGFT